MDNATDYMDEYINSLDLNEVFNALIRDYDYEDLVTIDYDSGNLLDNPIYKVKDERLKASYVNAVKRGVVGNFWEQSESGRSFRHISVNREFGNNNRFRLYLCPEDQYLYEIVNEILKRACRQNIPVYLKYSRRNRYDKILCYTRHPNEIVMITNLLEDIKKDHPKWFNNLKKSSAWLTESKFKGAYIAPEKVTKRYNNQEYSSYTMAFYSMLSTIKNELFFHFRVNSIQELKQYRKQEVYKAFVKYFKREIGKMGLLPAYYKDELVIYGNKLFPGFGKSVDEDIILTDEGLEIGKKVDAASSRYYKIPFGSTIPMKQEEFNRFNSYIIDNVTMINKKLYPGLYNESKGLHKK